jgi:hypothetical protein
MIRHLSQVVLVVVSTILLGLPALGQENKIYALFELPFDSPQDGPFPSDWFTVRDDTQNTGLRVSLAKPDCQASVSDCQDLDVINELDGFNLQPRLSIPFSGPIDPDSVTSETVFLISLGSTLQNDVGTPWGTRVGIEQVVWDPDTSTLHVESDELLDQHTRYALVVTKRLRDEYGKETKGAKEFLQFIDDGVTESTGSPDLDAYRAVLRSALAALDTHGIVPKGQVIAASVLTTQSATAILEKIRDHIHAETPEPADFLLGPSGGRTVFFLDQISSVLWNQQTGTAPAFTLRTLDLSAIRTFPGTIDRVAFGKYPSPDFRVAGGYIPPVGTRTGTPAVERINEIYFNLYLPSGPMPPNGWPVAILGHGVNGSKNIMGTYTGAPPGDRGRDAIASAMAAQGIASITTNAVGAGFGSLGTLTVNTMAGSSVIFAAGGRGVDRDPPLGQIGPNEGGIPAPPRRIVHYSDAFRQTAADLMQLVRVIEVGMDADGDGLRDLDPSRIYFDGGSWSGGYGSVFVPVEPHIRAAVLRAPADPVWIGSLGPANRRAAGAILGSRQRSLLNPPGVSVFAGIPVPPVPPATAPRFDENLPLRNHIGLDVELESGATRTIQSPVRNDVAGAMAIQEFFDHIEWVSQAGSPVAYAPHIRKAPLPAVPARNVLYVILKGDQTAPNPTATAIVRAGELPDRTMYYRHDLAVLDYGLQDTNPHGFNIASIWPTYLQLGATFVATDGAIVLQPDARYFEFPIPYPLPEGLNFIR